MSSYQVIITKKSSQSMFALMGFCNRLTRMRTELPVPLFGLSQFLHLFHFRRTVFKK